MFPLSIFVITVLYFIQEINCGPVYGPPYPFDRIPFVNLMEQSVPTAPISNKYRPPTEDEKYYMLLRCIEYFPKMVDPMDGLDYCGEPKYVLVSSKTATTISATTTPRMTTRGTTEMNPISSAVPPGFTTSGTTTASSALGTHPIPNYIPTSTTPRLIIGFQG